MPKSSRCRMCSRALLYLSLWGLLWTPIGCDDGELQTPTPASPMENGQMVYTTPLSTSSTFSCSTCHALAEPAADGIRRPGHAIGDATRRTSWKNGAVDSFREAANSCLTEWMNTDAWDETNPQYQALWTFLEATADTNNIALGAGNNITIDRVDPPADVTGGDAAAGKTLFNASCVVCHGENGGGTLRGPPVAGRALDESYIANRIRLSGRADSGVYSGLTGGIMPFWGGDRLTDDEVRDLVAFVATSDAMPDPMVTPPPDPDPIATCEATHEKVGWVADLSTKFHMVSGQARIVDNCNIVLENFNYDGSGIDVRAYLGANGDYTNGTAVGPQLLKTSGYVNDKVMLSLGDGVDLDSVDGLSIWCVAVGVSFGDGMFAPPL